jgi:hypothetical protein
MTLADAASPSWPERHTPHHARHGPQRSRQTRPRHPHLCTVQTVDKRHLRMTRARPASRPQAAPGSPPWTCRRCSHTPPANTRRHDARRSVSRDTTAHARRASARADTYHAVGLHAHEGLGLQVGGDDDEAACEGLRRVVADEAANDHARLARPAVDLLAQQPARQHAGHVARQATAPTRRARTQQRTCRRSRASSTW